MSSPGGWPILLVKKGVCSLRLYVAPFLDRFPTAYLDDILVYSVTQEEHREQVKQILRALSENG